MLCVGRAMSLQINMHVYFGFAFFFYLAKSKTIRIFPIHRSFGNCWLVPENMNMLCVVWYGVVWELRGRVESSRVESVVCCVYISSAYGMLGDFPSSVVRTMSEWTDLFMLRASFANHFSIAIHIIRLRTIFRLFRFCDYSHFQILCEIKCEQSRHLTVELVEIHLIGFTIFEIFFWFGCRWNQWISESEQKQRNCILNANILCGDRMKCDNHLLRNNKMRTE